MAKKLSTEDRNRLDQALASYRGWQPAPDQLPCLIDQLGGDSNRSFLVGDGPARWVLRLNNPITDPGINRRNERAALETAHEAGIAPLPCFQTNEILVTPFVVGERATLEDLPAIGDLFARVHSLEVELAPLNLSQHLQNYFEHAAPSRQLEDCYRHIVESYPSEIVELKPCHNDCLLPNMVHASEGFRLIDWEYAAAADPAYDLAVFSATYDLDSEQLGVMLSAYISEGVDNMDSLVARVKYFEKYYRLIEILWWEHRGRPMAEELDGLIRGLDI